jgi:hypothetical protein
MNPPLWMADVLCVSSDYAASVLSPVVGVETQINICERINYKINRVDELSYLHNDRIKKCKKLRFTVIVTDVNNKNLCHISVFWYDIFLEKLLSTHGFRR